MLKKQANIDDYIKLIGAIIRQAIEDIADPNINIQKSAKAFLRGQDFKNYCSLFGSNPEKILLKAGLTESDITLSKNNDAKNLKYKYPKDMTPEELKEYRATYRREYNAKNPERRAQLNIMRRAKYKETQLLS